jgi:hypothetical protein
MVAFSLRLLDFAVLIYFIRSGLDDQFERPTLDIEAPENVAQAEPKNTQSLITRLAGITFQTMQF